MKNIYEGESKSGKAIVVRYPLKEDLEQMLKYINDLSDEKTFIRNQGEHETLESEEKYLTETLEQIKNRKSVNLLAIINGEIVGITGIHKLDKTEKHIGVFGISVRKDFRGEGIGKILMQSILQEATEKLDGLKIVTLEVFEQNRVALEMYSKFGFVEYGRLPGGISRGGGTEDAILMYKNVNGTL